MLNLKDYQSFFSNNLYQGPKKQYWDSTMSSIFKSQLNKNLIIDDKITKKSLKYFLLFLEELHSENKYLIISPLKHRGPRFLKLNKRRLKFKNWLDRLDSYYIPLAFNNKDFSYLEYANEIARRRKLFADEFKRKRPSSPLKQTLFNSKSLFVEKEWISGCITNRVALKRNHLTFKYTPLRSFFPQIKKK
jgi:ribosomal protein S2